MENTNTHPLTPLAGGIDENSPPAKGLGVVLIIGAKGNLGQDLAAVYRAAGEEVLAWDREDIDITDEGPAREKITATRPTVIINATGYNAVDKAEETPIEFDLAKKLNGRAPAFLAELAKELDASMVNYVSDYVFDGEKGEYTEEDATHPISNYGISKEMGEKGMREVGGKYYLIRTSKLFGKAGASPTSKKNFFEIMLGAAKTKPELQVVDSERSCFTYTPDLALATKDLCDHPEKYAYGTYHIVNEGAVTWYQAALKLFELAKVSVKVIPVPPETFPRPAKRPKSSVLINTKHPKLRSYEEALKEWLNNR